MCNANGIAKLVSVVADPVTVRKCGSRRDEPDSPKKGCTEKLQGNDKILVGSLNWCGNQY